MTYLFDAFNRILTGGKVSVVVVPSWRTGAMPHWARVLLWYLALAAPLAGVLAGPELLQSGSASNLFQLLAEKSMLLPSTPQVSSSVCLV